MSTSSQIPEPGPQAARTEVVEEGHDDQEVKVATEPQSKRAAVGVFLKDAWTSGRNEMMKKGATEYAKGKLKLQHSLGLGHKPNVVPLGEAITTGGHRKVEIGWHPVGGLGGKWFAEQTGLGRYITKEVKTYPDPTQHWAVLVGEYGHELWMDESLDIIYINEVIKRDEWHTFEVGETRFNDEALRQAGEMVIHNMREKRPAYNLISNNCQNFAVNLLDAIKVGAHRDFATAFAVYSRATGKGAIKDLFQDETPQGDEKPSLGRQDTTQQAQQVMQENTTKLDAHKSRFS